MRSGDSSSVTDDSMIITRNSECAPSYVLRMLHTSGAYNRKKDRRSIVQKIKK